MGPHPRSSSLTTALIRLSLIGMSLLALGFVMGCGGGSLAGASRNVEVGDVRFTLPATMAADAEPQDSDVFVGRPGGKEHQLPLIVVTAKTTRKPWERVVSELYQYNTIDVEDFAPRADTPIDVPGADAARELVHTFGARQPGGGTAPATLTTIAFHRGSRVWTFRMAVADVNSRALDVDAITKSIKVTSLRTASPARPR